MAFALPSPSNLVEEQAQASAVTHEELTLKDLKSENSQVSAAGEVTFSPSSVAEEEDVDEDLRAPVELIIEFLRAVTDRDFQLARKLCQMILIYEPENPEASEFLPLIQRKLQEEQGMELSNDEDDEDDNSSGSDEESSLSSSYSSSSSSDDDDEKREKQVTKHKLYPPDISP